MCCSNDMDMEVDHYSNGVSEATSNGFLNGSSRHDVELEDCDNDMGTVGLPLVANLPHCHRLYSETSQSCLWVHVGFSGGLGGCRSAVSGSGVDPLRVRADVDPTLPRRQLCGGSQAAIERMIQFGRELQSMSENLRRECGKNAANKKMLKVCLILPPGPEHHLKTWNWL